MTYLNIKLWFIQVLLQLQNLGVLCIHLLRRKLHWIEILLMINTHFMCHGRYIYHPFKTSPFTPHQVWLPDKKRFQMIFFFGKRLKKILIPGKGSAVSCSLMKIYPQSKNISEFPSFTSLSKFWGKCFELKISSV